MHKIQIYLNINLHEGYKWQLFKIINEKKNQNIAFITFLLKIHQWIPIVFRSAANLITMAYNALNRKVKENTYVIEHFPVVTLRKVERK